MMISNRLRSVFAAAGLLAVTLVPASAGEAGDMLARWYDALQSGEDAPVAALLAEDAVIRLEDIGVDQTRAEFIDSLTEWRDAFDGGSLDWKIESEAADGAVALVCYRFPSNAMTVREDFTISGGLVEKSVQTQVADNCDGF